MDATGSDLYLFATSKERGGGPDALYRCADLPSGLTDGLGLGPVQTFRPPRPM
jgi:hypothetical protein